MSKLARSVQTSLVWIVLLVAIDQVTKASFDGLPAANTGMLGGFLADLHPTIGRVFFSVVGMYIFVFALLLIYLLRPKRTPWLKRGIATFSAGLLGNVIDRAIRGFVVDFIPIATGNDSFFVFNVADLWIAMGSVALAYSFFGEYRQIWHENDLRKRYVVDRPFQYQYIGVLISFGVAQAAVLGVYSYSFLSVYLGADRIAAEPSTSLIRDYLIGLAILQGCFLVIACFLGILFSHRAAGPIYAFEAFVARWLKDPARAQAESLQLRRTDHFKTLERIARQIARTDHRERSKPE